MDLVELKKGNQKRHPWELARFEVVLQLLKPYLSLNKNQEITILDMGCGDTFFIENMAKRVPNASFIGIDIAFETDLLTDLKAKYKDAPIDVFPSLEDALVQNPKQSIDIVMLLDVIEHIEDDISFLKYLGASETIHENTIFIITVPAYQSLFCSHDVFLKHYRRYTNQTVENHISQAHFQVISKGYFFLSLLIIRIIGVFIEKNFTSKNKEAKGIGGWQGGTWKTKLIRYTLMLDFRVSQIFRKIGIRLPGLSNYAICQKRAS